MGKFWLINQDKLLFFYCLIQIIDQFTLAFAFMLIGREIKNRIGIPSLILGSQHGGICIDQQILQILAMLRIHGDPDTARDIDGLATDLETFLNQFQNLF